MSDRKNELLVALLAAQMNLISADKLRELLTSWNRDRSVDVLDLLRNQAGLAEDELALLQGLAGHYVHRHEGNLQESIQDLPLSDAVDQSIAGLEIPELEGRKRSNEKTASATPSGTDSSPPTESPATEGPALASRLTEPLESVPERKGQGRFSIVRPHARGGLGEVFVAFDHELNRYVALKEIQSEFAANPVSRERFLVEAEITGGLEHPGIVPVYGLGSYGDGRPFYAMRFVKGQSLAEAVGDFHRSNPEPSSADYLSSNYRQLLSRFMDVCNAIEYAHARGVLHRDIKPGNIMLGKYGETLVVDWGLAKTLQHRPHGDAAEFQEATLRLSSGSSSSKTTFGQLVGTIPYMSPEAARGAVDELGVPSDIYCLGSTLYFLLTGRPPFQGSSSDMVADVRVGKFPQPQEIKPNIPAALQAICLKAMQVEPSQRYSSAEALSQDIDSWLADEPIAVYRDPWFDRVARSVRRNRQAFVASAVFASLLLVGALTSALILSGKNRQLNAANILAQANFDLAEKQRQKADENAETARRIALTVTEIAEEKLSQLPNQSVYRETLMDRARDLLEQSLKDEPNNNVVITNLGRVLRMTANVKHKLKKHEEAENLIARSIELQLSLKPEENDALLHLANAYRDQGSMAKSQDKLESAAAAYDNANRLLVQVSEKFGVDRDTQQLEGTLNIEQIGLAMDLADYDTALQCAARAEEIFLSRVASDQAEALDYVLANMAAYRHGQALYELGQVEAGRELYQRAIERGEEWLERLPIFDLRQVQARLHLYYATDMFRQPTVDENAKAIADEAVRLYEILYETTESTIYRAYLARARAVQAYGLEKSDGAEAALAQWEECISELKDCLAKDGSSSYWVPLADVFQAKSECLRRLNRLDEARTALEEAVDACKSAVEASPSALALKSQLQNLEQQLQSL